jgi:hypothetical protein
VSPESACETTQELDAPTLAQALKTPIGRRMPRQMRAIAVRVAGGEDVARIAQDCGMSVEFIKANVNAILPSLHCQKPTFVEGRPNRKSRTAASQAPAPKLPIFERTTCHRCGSTIAAGDERYLLIAARAVYGHEELWGHVPTLNDERVFHYCHACSETDQIVIERPWFTGRDFTAADKRELRSWQQEIQSKTEDMESRLKAAVATEDVDELNRLLPSRPSSEDALARLSGVAVERVAVVCKLPAKKSDATKSTAAKSVEIPDNLDASRVTGEAGQRERVRRYLQAPMSRGRLAPQMREALHLWVNGASQKDVERKLSISQSTLSRVIKSVQSAR